MNLRDEALRYAAAGIPVFPLHWIKQDGTCSCRQGDLCECKGKHPRIKNWGEEASTDPEKVGAWWDKAPLANIGIPMGERSGLVTLDVDTRHGGDKSLEQLEQEFGKLPTTITATTGGGGKHYIFKYTEELCLKNVVGFRDGLDVRTQGGMIVAAPSLHQSGNRYAWDEGLSPFEAEAADMPEWLIAEIRKVGTKLTTKKKTDPAPRKKIKEGGRNNHLTSLAGSLRRKGISEDGIIATLRAENKDRLDPPLDDDTVVAIARSITRYQPEDESEDFKLTDAGNADRFVNMFGSDIRYSNVHKKWYIWNGKFWEQDEGTIISYAIACVRNIINEANLLPDGDRRRELIKHSLRSEAAGRLRAIVEIASNYTQLKITPDEMDANPWLLNCENGTLNLKTGRLQPFNSADFMTKCCKTKYDPNCPTPLWDSLMEKITNGDEEMKKYIQKAFGYALTGDISEQCIFILYGTGSNGKSTMLNVFSELMSGYAQSTKSETFMEKKNESVNNDIARLNGARFVTAIEMQENKRMSEELIKSMTGGDKLVTRFLYGEFFEYLPQFKVFLAANHKPVIRDTTNSIWRRIKLIQFTNTFTEQERDKNFSAKIMANELPGILAWAVKGCLLWQQEGLRTPDEVARATAAYRTEMDAFTNFFTECCVDDPEGRVSNKMLRAKYDEWSKENGEYALSQRPFSQKLIERGYQKKNSSGNGAIEWYGFRIRGEAARL
jgi:putative DNA primase/helicase